MLYSHGLDNVEHVNSIQKYFRNHIGPTYRPSWDLTQSFMTLA